MSTYQPRHALARVVRSLPPRARVAIVAVAALAASGAGVAASVSASAATCTAVMTSKGMLTAAVIDTAVTPGSTVDASGCDIGVYYGGNGGSDSTLSGVTVENATQYGVFVDGATDVRVTGSTVTNIGDHPFDGAQHGVGIYFGNGATGTVSGNTVSQYQKGGIVVDGVGSSAIVTDNTVTGLGPVGFIAQNGIQISRGAAASPDLVSGNTVSGNIYTQGAAKGYVSTGLLLYQASSTGTVGQYARSNRVFRNQANITLISG